MRVLHVLHTSRPFICGYSIRSDYILRYQRQAETEVRVVTSAQHPNGAEPAEVLDGILHSRTRGPKGKFPPLAREIALMRALEARLAEAVSEWRPDLIHAHSPVLVGLPALRVARRLGVPLVYEVRDLWENASVDRGKFSPGSPFYRLARGMETYLLRRADAVVTICNRLREELAGRAASPQRVHVVANGVDTEQFHPRPTDPSVRDRWNPAGKATIGYIGTFQPYEGLDLLVEAMKTICAASPATQLLITGSGGEEERLRALVAARGLDATVTFTGRVPHDQVKQLYSLADLMVYPRILTRTTALTTPLKPVEAMAMGKPVLVSDVPAMRELVHPGLTGATFQAGDLQSLASTCIKLLQDPELRARMGRSALEWVRQEREWRHLISHYSEIYASCA